MLGQRGKLRFSIGIDSWLAQATSVPGIEVAPLTLEAISIAVRLPGLRDPADQLIVATALERGARLVTSDERISESGAVSVVS